MNEQVKKIRDKIESIDDTAYYCDYTNFDINDQDNWILVQGDTFNGDTNTKDLELREKDAGMALQGLCSQPYIDGALSERVAECCVLLADSLIKELKKRK